MTLSLSVESPPVVECFNVTIIDDRTQENDEVFLYRLEFGEGFESSIPIPIAPNVTTITIADDNDPGI